MASPDERPPRIDELHFVRGDTELCLTENWAFEKMFANFRNMFEVCDFFSSLVNLFKPVGMRLNAFGYYVWMCSDAFKVFRKFQTFLNFQFKNTCSAIYVSFSRAT